MTRDLFLGSNSIFLIEIVMQFVCLFRNVKFLYSTTLSLGDFLFRRLLDDTWLWSYKKNFNSWQSTFNILESIARWSGLMIRLGKTSLDASFTYFDEDPGARILRWIRCFVDGITNSRGGVDSIPVVFIISTLILIMRLFQTEVIRSDFRSLNSFSASAYKSNSICSPILSSSVYAHSKVSLLVCCTSKENCTHFISLTRS